MILIFNNIRQRQFAENLPDWQAGHFSRCVIYALGEIVLVVFLILKAFRCPQPLKVRVFPQISKPM